MDGGGSPGGGSSGWGLMNRGVEGGLGILQTLGSPGQRLIQLDPEFRWDFPRRTATAILWLEPGLEQTELPVELEASWISGPNET